MKAALLILAGALLPGCGAPPPRASGEDAGSAPAVTQKQADDDSGQGAVTLRVTDYDGVMELITGHKGKVVVMDCWSTSCEPCLREFPGLVKLHEKHGPEKVACVSLSFDYEGLESTEEIEPRVLEFLKKQRATFDNLLSSEESDALSKKFKFGAIPAVFVYDQEGKLAKQFINSVKYDEIGAFVEELLAGK